MPPNTERFQERSLPVTYRCKLVRSADRTAMTGHAVIEAVRPFGRAQRREPVPSARLRCSTSSIGLAESASWVCAIAHASSLVGSERQAVNSARPISPSHRKRCCLQRISPLSRHSQNVLVHAWTAFRLRTLVALAQWACCVIFCEFPCIFWPDWTDWPDRVEDDDGCTLAAAGSQEPIQ